MKQQKEKKKLNESVIIWAQGPFIFEDFFYIFFIFIFFSNKNINQVLNAS
jgi:hypothetical protein